MLTVRGVQELFAYGRNVSLLAMSPDMLAPMLLSSASQPPADDGKWAYEVKWDGFRVLASVSPSGWRVWSRRGTDFTAAFPELDGLPKAMRGESAVLDGELVCFAPEGRTSFARIRRRWTPSGRQQAGRLSRECPATFVVFDLLRLGDRSVINLAYKERRELLAGLQLADQHWLTTAYHVGDGTALAKASRSQHLEGLVAKRLSSLYWPGRRSPHWIKLKNYERQRFVVGGWLHDGAGHLEALLVGRETPEGLVYCGTVEFGLDGHRRTVHELLEMVSTTRSPFLRSGAQRKGVRYVEPRLETQVRFIGWDGPVLREAIFEGLALRGQPMAKPRR